MSARHRFPRARRPQRNLHNVASGTPNPQGATSPGSPHKWDRYLTLGANAAQIGLLILGVGGYFYTVVPVFQNQKLQEDLAQLSLEKEAEQKKLDTLLADQLRVRKQTEDLRREVEIQQAHANDMTKRATLAERNEVASRRIAELAAKESHKDLADLDHARWQLVLSEFDMAVIFAGMRMWDVGQHDIYKDNDPQGKFITESAVYWPDPYKQVADTLPIFQKTSGVNGDIPSHYFDEIRTFLTSNHKILVCNPPDYAALQKQYVVDYQEIDEATKADLKKYLDSIQQESADKGDKVLITDDFKNSSERSIRIVKEINLKSRYQGLMMEPRKQCSDAIQRFFEAIAKEKGVTLD